MNEFHRFKVIRGARPMLAACECGVLMRRDRVDPSRREYQRLGSDVWVKRSPPHVKMTTIPTTP